MGILDEAIRQHLELKRRHGAAEQDVQRLEDEAFGPPSRPGEPDFPEAGGEAPTNGAEGDTAHEVPDGPEPETAVAEVDAPEPDAATEAPSEEHPGAEKPAGEGAPAAPPTPPPSTGELDLETDEEEAVFFDREVEDDLDLGELDLALDEEEALASDELSAELEGDGEDVRDPEDSAAEPPVDPLATEEHQVEEVEVEEQGGEGTEDSEEDGDDDVLADTPDFLRDAPEDDELWFEQGEPKDFDFEE